MCLSHFRPIDFLFIFLSEEIHHMHIKMFFFFQLHQAFSLMFSDMILLRFLGNFGVTLHRLNLATTKALLRIRKWLEEKDKSGKKQNGWGNHSEIRSLTTQLSYKYVKGSEYEYYFFPLLFGHLLYYKTIFSGHLLWCMFGFPFGK